MMQWILNAMPWWAWAVPLFAIVGMAWHFLGSKGAAGATVGAVIALISARSRQKGYDAARRENEAREINEYVETRKRTDAVHHADADAARRAMHERQPNQR